MTQLPMTVIGGFLGSGKTTLLNAILQQAQTTRYAVLVNDFGAINIDERLIISHDGQTLTLSNGCICCSLANGFIEILIDLMAKQDRFDHIIVEASGVANPARILDIAQLDPDLRADGCIVLIDSSQIVSQLADPLISDLVIAQLQSADLLLLNKIDLLGSGATAAFENTMSDLNTRLADVVPSHVPCLPCCVETLPIDAVLGPHVTLDTKLRSGLYRDSPHFTFKSVVLRALQPVLQRRFETFLAELPTQVLRGKGYVQLQDCHGKAACALWHRVGTRMSLEHLHTQDQTKPNQTELLLISTGDLQQVELMWQDAVVHPNS